MSLQPGAGWSPADGGAGRAVPGWLAALRRGDRATFETTVRHTQERVAGHLLGALRLPPDQAVELTGQTVLDALRTAGQSAAIESPLARLYGAARAGLPDRLHAAFGDIAGLDEPFDPEPPQSALLAFYAGDGGAERALAHRRDLPPFLELLHEAMASLPADERAMVDAGWPPAVLAVAGALLLAHARPDSCGGLDAQLGRIGWQPGRSLDPAGRTAVLAHVGACARCLPSYQRAAGRVGDLPPLLLWVTLRLAEQRQHLTDAIFTDAPGGVPAADPVAPLALPAGTGHPPASPPGSPPGSPAGSPAGPARGSGRRRRGFAAAAALAVLGAGLAGWRWLPASEPAGPVAVQVASGGPADLDGALDPAGSAPTDQPATTASATPTAATPTSTPSRPGTTAGSDRPARPSPSRPPASHTAAPPPRTPTGSATAAPPAKPPARPVGQLVIRLSRRSTGGMTVTVGGAPAGSCVNAGGLCVFTVRSGDTVTLRPVDVALSWTGPCRGTAVGRSCSFVAGTSTEVDAWVLRFAR